ncbi:ribosomal protein S18-alanine N-acetyltransferase [Sphingorhabdus sp. YGSMI21]|uniref:ribosomal protein S18-alanine N-acetyltransferase n=1 Tax=Sphingorhabdus sp. YGSMI21 TaxID=2077182 RepID=UPI000C1E1F92|nr:ribosomal protein S18-alanine N-acetyltransferase [Sphingorhabdus sp. YGSMI21]ATW04625.1 ribosomal-protein-alanine N-acetyltransferase [Sphingorhabdus sp. YGSMI21]
MATRQSPWEDEGVDPVVIRTGDLNDLSDVMHVMEHAFPKTYGEGWNHHQCRSMLSMPNARLLIAECKDMICGFLISRQAADEEELLMIAVSPAYQSRGVGYQLLDQMLKSAQSHGVSAVFLEMRADNTAQKLYTKFGFERIGLRKAYYTGPNKEKFDAVTYKAMLTI